MKLLLAVPYLLAAAVWGQAHGALETLALAGGALMTLGLIRRWFVAKWRRVEAYMAEQRRERAEQRQVRDVVLGDEATPGVKEQLAVIRREQLVVRQELKEELERGAERMDRIETKVDRVADELNGHEDGIRDRIAKIEGHIDVVAEASRQRVDDALAGDPRTPVERRKHRPD